jgi:hypothetical protein
VNNINVIDLLLLLVFEAHYIYNQYIIHKYNHILIITLFLVYILYIIIVYNFYRFVFRERLLKMVTLMFISIFLNHLIFHRLL